MKKPMVITGPPASGKSLKARELAQHCGRFVTAVWGDSFERFANMRPDAIIIEEVPHPDLWPAAAWANLQRFITEELAPQLILVMQSSVGQLPPDWFDNVRCAGCGVAVGELHQAVCAPVLIGKPFTPLRGRGGAGRGQGNKAGSHRVAEPRNFKSTQRYTDAERRLLEGVAGGPGEVGAFIRDAAVDRAQQFADQGAGQ